MKSVSYTKQRNVSKKHVKMGVTGYLGVQKNSWVDFDAKLNSLVLDKWLDWIGDGQFCSVSEAISNCRSENTLE